MERRTKLYEHYLCNKTVLKGNINPDNPYMILLHGNSY